MQSLGKYKRQKLDDSDIGTLDAARADYLAACSTTMTSRAKTSKPGKGEEANEEKRRREEEDQHKNEQRRIQGSEEDHKEKSILHIIRNRTICLCLKRSLQVSFLKNASCASEVASFYRLEHQNKNKVLENIFR